MGKYGFISLEDPNSEYSTVSSQLDSTPEDMSDMVISGSTQSLAKLTVIIGWVCFNVFLKF